MKSTDKIRVAVLYGGRSAEHEVSLQSAANVIQYLDKTLFDVIPVGIDKQGNWLIGEEVFSQSLEHKKVPALPNSVDTWFTAEWVGKSVNKQPAKALVTQNPSDLLFDVVFPAVHGPLCEDGTLQGLLELADLPYVGCGVLASSVGMDKDFSKRLVSHADIKISPYQVIHKDAWKKDAVSFMSQIEETLNYPVFVKPANTGSSVGISKVKAKETLLKAIDEAFKFDTKVIIEKALDIIELEVAVLESLESCSDPISSVVGEIRSKHEFYSYEAKYIDEQGAELVIPATISDELKEQACAVARKVFRVLECEGMARVDLFLTKDTGQIYFNELNTIPGFTKISMYPKLMDASGIPYTELLTHLVKLAMKRHKTRHQLIRNYDI